MNAYDFDKTIYAGDSSVDFYLFTLRRHPSVFLLWPSQIAAFFRYKSGRCDKTAMKQVFFTFVKRIPDIESEVALFWDKKEKKIYDWYRAQMREDDVIISASPEFLLGDICKRLGLSAPIASRLDEKSGEFCGKNCHDTEKVLRFRELYGDAEIEKFYSDSRSDTPMAAIAKEAFFIRRGRPEPWGEINLLDHYD
ncbi:MAG: haloacid dehalogenase-like hydrolase [Clostridia bacterium]|nr:haloacid dehalogenase-like hydrolase [Clostridia bacterium]